MTYIPVPKGLFPRVSLNAYTDAGAEAKAAFHRDGKAFLRKLAQALGLRTGEYCLSNNLAGVAVSGEVTLHTKDLYVQLYESCTSRGVSVLYRSCDSLQDYCGGRNCFTTMAAILGQGAQERFRDNLAEIIRDERARKAGLVPS